jgi:hypothetical protein
MPIRPYTLGKTFVVMQSHLAVRARNKTLRHSVRNKLIILYYNSHDSQKRAFTLMTWASTVDISTGYGLDDRAVGVRDSVGTRVFFSPRRSDRLWDSPNLLSTGYRGLFPLEESGWGLKHTTHHQIVPEVKKMWIYTSIPPYDGAMLN